MHGAALMVRNVNATSTLMSALVHRWSEHLHQIHRHRHRHRHRRENDNDGRAVGSGWCTGRPGKHSNNTHDDDDAADDDDADDDDDANDDEFQCIIGLP